MNLRVSVHAPGIIAQALRRETSQSACPWDRAYLENAIIKGLSSEIGKFTKQGVFVRNYAELRREMLTHADGIIHQASRHPDFSSNKSLAFKVVRSEATRLAYGIVKAYTTRIGVYEHAGTPSSRSSVVVDITNYSALVNGVEVPLDDVTLVAVDKRTQRSVSWRTLAVLAENLSELNARMSKSRPAPNPSAGGKARAKKLTKRKRVSIARQSARKRWCACRQQASSENQVQKSIPAGSKKSARTSTKTKSKKQ